MNFRTLCLTAVAAVALATGAHTPSGAQVVPPSAEDFARIPAISSVRISPDGKHIAALTSHDGKTVTLSIWKADAMDQAPYVIGSNDRVRFIGVSFVKNDRLVVTTRQTFTIGTTKTHIQKLLVTDLKGSIIPILQGGRATSETEKFYESISNPSILSALPRDPQHIIVQNTNPVNGAGDIYKVNVYTGKDERIYRGSEKYGSTQLDLNGEVRARIEQNHDNGSYYLSQWIRSPDSDVWEEHFRWYAKDREPISIVGFTTDPNIAYVATNKGRDKAAIFEYDIRAKKLLEPAFEHKMFDALGVIQSNAAQDFGQPRGFVYYGETVKDYWIDPKLEAINKGLRQALGVQTKTVDWTDISTGEKIKYRTGDGADVSIMGYSEDLTKILVEKSGPKLAPEYYLLEDGKQLRLLGKSNPAIKPEALGDTRLAQYPARDGLMIPAFLTTPPASFGKGPHPAIVLPHGGPWARDGLDWDASGWTQYFAARGYVVLQPQYRGSDGWGQKLWRSGDLEWGQKMQDDKDDGARWLAAQGIAAADRIAMHGYSYGGFAAMAAAVRPDSPYQCAIAGAGVSDLNWARREWSEDPTQKQFQGSTVGGMSPLANLEKVVMPVYVYHGDRDQTVPIKQSEQFVARLKSSGKTVKYLELKDMGHQYWTWTPEHTSAVLTSVEQFLKNDCGPGGL